MKYEKDEHTFEMSIHEARQLFDCLENEMVISAAPEPLRSFFSEFLDDFTYALDACQGDAHIDDKKQIIKIVIG